MVCAVPLVPLDPYSSGDLEMNLMVQRLREVFGYDVHLFDSTMEHGIPSVWVLAKNRTNQGINMICAAGHLDPNEGGKGAIHEIAGIFACV